MELLCYVDYIKYERVKIQSFLSGLPTSYKDRIDFIDPQTMEETILMATYCYEQGKVKVEVQPTWKEKPKGRFKPRKRKF